jgi:hypothetical protein
MNPAARPTKPRKAPQAPPLARCRPRAARTPATAAGRAARGAT